MELLDMVKGYQSLLETKEALAAQTKENNAAIEAAKAQIAQQMVDDDCPSISTGGSTMKDYVEEHGELSEELAKVITTYETYDIGRRRETAKKGGGHK